MPDVPASSELRSEEDNTLVSRSKLYNEAFAAKDLNRLNALFDAKVVYHADEVTLRSNVKGKAEVLEYIKSYFDKWDFERVETFGATNDKENLAFSVSVDKGVTPKPGVHDEQREKNQVKPSSVINITALFFDGDSGLLTHIYAARQLSFDEAHRKMQFVPDYKGSTFNPEWLEKSEVKPSGDRIEFHKEFAEDWNQMFCKNDVSLAEKICDPNIKVHNLLLSQETSGLDDFKKSLSDIFSDWECTSNTSHIGVTAGNKAFVLWETQGLYKDDKSSVWGITVLLFNEKQIKEAASIFQPFPKMRKNISKGG